MTIDYRSPGTGQPRIQEVLCQLELAEGMRWLAVAAKVAVGLPLCLVGPLLLTLLAGGIEARWTLEGGQNFTSVFLVSSIFLIPILLWLERRTQGEWGLESLRGESSPSSHGESEMLGYKFWYIFWTEFALLGPRMVWSVIDFLRGTTQVDLSTRVVAAHIIVTLLDADRALSVRELAAAESKPQQCVQAIKYLAERDWIDISRRRDRVWLRSPIRKRLANLQ